MNARCHNCDRPKATLDLWRHPGGCECAECVAHCWGCSDCEPHDWRAEALALRQRLERAETELATRLSLDIEALKARVDAKLVERLSLAELERAQVRIKYRAALTVLQALDVFADDLTVRANGLITPADTTAIDSWQRIYVDLKSMADKP